jgi:hypothetical protein
MRWILVVLAMFGSVQVEAQCCGDCDGSGEVGLLEVQGVFNRFLDGCEPVATGCRENFFTSTLDTNGCLFLGPFSSGCGSDLGSSFVGDRGDTVIAVFANPDFFIGSTDVQSGNSARITSWWTEDDFSDLELLGGTMTVSSDGRTFTVDPSTAPFTIGGCAFDRYVGTYQGPLAGAGFGQSSERHRNLIDGFKAAMERREVRELRE